MFAFAEAATRAPRRAPIRRFVARDGDGAIQRRVQALLGPSRADELFAVRAERRRLQKKLRVVEARLVELRREHIAPLARRRIELKQRIRKATYMEVSLKKPRPPPPPPDPASSLSCNVQ